MLTKTKIIFICTGNACRSQIAHGLLQDMASEKFEVFSAGSHPSRVHPMAVKVMEEIGIDISYHRSNFVDDYLSNGINIVITVCDNVNEICPVFPGKVEKIHWGINDPFRGSSFDTSQIQSFRDTRDEIKERIIKFVQNR